MVNNSEIMAAGLGLATLAIIETTVAQDITAFKNGYLTFTNENPALYYRVEFRPNLTGPDTWDGVYNGLKNIQTNAAVVTVPVGIFYRVVGSAELVGVGTAGPGDVLAPKTVFVNGKEIAGTMPNIGAQDITPGTSEQVIRSGYHDGTGTVVGDANLVANNIRKSVTIFGTTGSMLNASVPRTGQWLTYRAGDDGDLERGAALPSPRFTDHGDGTVTDNLTGLMWVKAPHSLAGNSGRSTWNTGIDFCGALTYAGYVDWRLPNIRELQSLVDYRQYNPALPFSQPFVSIQSAFYMSSTTAASQITLMFGVNFSSGGVGNDVKTAAHYVWPVRAGQ